VIRVVLDTNVLASAALTSTGPLARILTGALDADFALIIAPIIVAELERTLRKPYFAQRRGSERISQYIARLEAVAESVAITSVVAGVATRPEDDAILAMAVSGTADEHAYGTVSCLPIAVPIPPPFEVSIALYASYLPTALPLD
jgi:putative PIN family toxin of toxin-antitoxin system